MPLLFWQGLHYSLLGVLWTFRQCQFFQSLNTDFFSFHLYISYVSSFFQQSYSFSSTGLLPPHLNLFLGIFLCNYTGDCFLNFSF